MYNSSTGLPRAGWAALLALVILALCVVHAAPARAGVREVVQARGTLQCGVRTNVEGFSRLDASGRWSGFEIDFCRAIAAAVLGSADAVRFVPLADADRFRVLSEGAVDVLVGGAAWSLTRDTGLGVRFIEPYFYDGQGFLVRRSHAVFSALELSGASICAEKGTRSLDGVESYFGRRRMPYQLVLSNEWSEAVANYDAAACTVLTGSITMLAKERARLAAPLDHGLLPEAIAKEPLGPVVRRGDEDWFAIVRWVLMGLIRAEELGIGQGNVEAMSRAGDGEIRSLLGREADVGATLGLAPDWVYQMVRQVGNYGEIFARNLGTDSPLQLPRGLNGLWTEGGLLYAAPLR